jgi:hypothetical protein
MDFHFVRKCANANPQNRLNFSGRKPSSFSRYFSTLFQFHTTGIVSCFTILHDPLFWSWRYLENSKSMGHFPIKGEPRILNCKTIYIVRPSITYSNLGTTILSSRRYLNDHHLEFIHKKSTGISYCDITDHFESILY